VLLLAIVGSLAVWMWRDRRRTADRLERLARDLDALEVEERRMFDFLHGLGDKLQADHSPANMHRYIVDGVAEVVGGDAGVLYLIDAETNRLVPTYQSTQLAPVVPAPEEVLQETDLEEAESHYRGFIRLSLLLPGESFIGRVLREWQLTHAPDLSQEPDRK